MLSKNQQVFASAYNDIQRLIWNFRSENSTEKMLLRAKQQLTYSRKVVKLKKILIQRKGTYFRQGSNIFYWLCLVIYKHEFVNEPF